AAARVNTVAGTPPINPTGGAGAAPITGFLSTTQIGLSTVNWLSLLLKISVNFSWARSQRSSAGELKECGIFTAKITIKVASWGHIPGGLAALKVASLWPSKRHPENGIREIGQGSYDLRGDRLVYTGTYQVGNILGGGVTANPGVRVNISLPGPGGAGDVVRLSTIDIAKTQEGAQGSYLEMRDTMPGTDRDPFSKCPQ
ncbi:MAG TPA: hypothetical protein VFB82_03080, partial [Blastocatellia bacterium]|nr:hypothetical protein [Blastocatellia bacterium]